jgi:hypothetical protein
VQILGRRRWWRANRWKAAERFEQELAAALAAITERPDSFPVFSARGGRTVHRCLLVKTRCHLYFEILRELDEVWVIGARGARQRRGPKLARR